MWLHWICCTVLKTSNQLSPSLSSWTHCLMVEFRLGKWQNSVVHPELEKHKCGRCLIMWWHLTCQFLARNWHVSQFFASKKMTCKCLMARNLCVSCLWQGIGGQFFARNWYVIALWEWIDVSLAYDKELTCQFFARNWHINALWQRIDVSVAYGKELTCQFFARNWHVSALWQGIYVSVACGKELTYQFLAKSLVVSYEDQMLYRFTVHFIYLYFVIFFYCY